MILYRLCKAGESHELSPKGARLHGGRWNSKGIPLVYTCENRALLTAEAAVFTPLGLVPSDYRMQIIMLPEDISVGSLRPADLSRGWDAIPPETTSQYVGNELVKDGRICAVRVPSAVVPGDWNVLLNPLSKDFSRIEVLGSVPFRFDQRDYLSHAEGPW